MSSAAPFQLQAFASIVAVQAIAVFCVWWLHNRADLLKRYLGHAVSLAVGVLVATALLHLMPEAVAQLGDRPGIWIVFTCTLLLLFAIERIFSAITGNPAETAATDALSTVHHHHGHHTTRPMNLVFGGMLHSFLDGVSVASAFTVGRRVGVLTALAITLHEIPHRLGDFALFLHLRISPRRALHLATLVGVPSLLGVFLVTAVGHSGPEATDWLLPISAASFLYIASVNLMPELQHECRMPRVLSQLAALAAGAALAATLAKLPV